MSLREWYGERDILITGVTSQIGRYLLEKLLRSFPDVKVHLVLRTEDGLSEENRVKKKIFDLPGYERLRVERPDACSNINTYEGNLIYNKLGLSEYSQKALNNVSVVFHVGGSSECLLEFCKQLPNIKAIIVVDDLFRCKQDQIIESVMENDNYPKDLRLGIIRLPPVVPAFREPMPGYIEQLKAPTAMMIGAGHVLGRKDLPAEIIPVDIAINTLIVAAWDVGQRKIINEPLVYNASTIKCTWGDIIAKGGRASAKYRYPSFRLRGMTTSVILHHLIVFICEWLPSYTFDTILYMFNREERLLKEYERIRKLLDEFESVTYRKTAVTRHRVRELITQSLSAEELEMFPLCSEPIDLEAYILCAAAAVRKFVVGDKNLNIVRFFVPAVWLMVLIILFYQFYLRQ